MKFISRAIKYTFLHKTHYASYFILATSFTYFAAKYQNSPNEFVRLGFAGAIAQIATELIFHPIDVINTNTKANIIGKKNAIQTTINIYQIDGVFGFWRGAAATYYGSLIGGMLYFMIYKKIKSYIYRKERGVNSIAYLISSGLGEFLYLFVYYPFDLVRTRMQTRRPEYDYKGVLHGMRTILKGCNKKYSLFFQLYVGAGPSFILNISNQTIMFTVIESLREIMMKSKGYSSVSQLSSLQYMTCSLTAGVVSGAVTNILEVITIQKQLKGNQFHFIQFIHEQGYHAFTSGIWARIIINTAHTVMLFYAVDKVSIAFDVEL